MSDAIRPLSGVRVVEVASWVAVPAAGALMADLGAEVIKVELPPRGELFRRTRLRYMGFDSDFPEYPPFQMENRGKRSLVLDLTQEGDREALHRLIDRSDVLLTNLLPRRRKKYGLDHESLHARRPELVVGAITGYGLGGEEEDRPAFDYTAYYARSGMMDALHDEGTPPSVLRPGIGDHAAAVNLVCGVLAAMRMRDQTGKGRFVDVSLLQTGLHVMGNDIANALVTGESVRRHDRRAPNNPLWNSYPVRGDRWLLLVMIDSAPYWPRFCEAMERPEWRLDPRFESEALRAENTRELVAELEDLFGQHDLEEWSRRLDRHNLIWAPVRTVDEAVRDPQAEALGYLPEMKHWRAGSFRTVAAPFRIEGTDLAPRSAAPPLDADAVEVLKELGLDDEQIASLRGDRKAQNDPSLRRR